MYLGTMIEHDLTNADEVRLDLDREREAESVWESQLHGQTVPEQPPLHSSSVGSVSGSSGSVGSVGSVSGSDGSSGSSSSSRFCCMNE